MVFVVVLMIWYGRKRKRDSRRWEEGEVLWHGIQFWQGPTGSGFRLTGLPKKYAERVKLSASGPKYENYFFIRLAASLYGTCRFPVKQLSQNALWVQLST